MGVVLVLGAAGFSGVLWGLAAELTNGNPCILSRPTGMAHASRAAHTLSDAFLLTI
jgi:hypothetical protein